MAWEVISTNQTNPYYVGATDFVTLLGGVSITSEHADGALVARSNSLMGLTVLGDISALYTGIALGQTATAAHYSRLAIGAEATVASGLGSGVVFSQVGAVLDNAGAITAYVVGVDVAAGSEQVQIGNAGSIVARGVGVRFSGSAGGVDAVNTLDNAGLIAGATGQGVVANHDSLVLSNTGTIRSASGAAVQFASLDAGGELTLRNAGTLAAGAGAALAVDASTSSAGNQIVNHGLIAGGVALGDGADRVINTGLIDGDVLLNGGDNLYRGQRGTLTGELTSGTGDDVLLLGADDDVVSASGGADRVLGGQGDDTIDAGAGDDVLRGGAGEDRLRGGAGADTMAGGAEADVFVFEVGDLAVAGVDRIVGFEKGLDVIDLTELSGGKFLFMGAKAFKGGGKASISLKAAKGDTQVKLDVNGDGALDGTILVDGVTGLVAGDFLL